MNEAGLQLLKDYEGFRSDAYLDMVGVPTIGYGFTAGVKLGDHMTVAEADARLADEVSKFENGLGLDGTENQLSAMTCLAYNIGLGNFSISTVKNRHICGDFQGAADAFRMWSKAGGREVPGLIRRREAERSLYLSE